MQLCEFCESKLTGSSHGDGDWTYLTCGACGSYRVSGLWRASQMREHLDPLDRIRLRGVVREETDLYGECKEVITNDGYQRIVARHRQPPTPLAQVDRFLEIVAEQAGTLGGESRTENYLQLVRRLYIDSSSQFHRFVQALEKMGFLDLVGFNGKEFVCTLTLKGWERAEELRKAAVVGSQAFVAMWFHEGMGAAYERGIHPAVEACGYSPYIVNRRPTDKKIDDEIIANIRKSRLVIADLTGLRPSVFYEAGFAHGLGIQLVLTCQRGPRVPFTQVAPDGNTPEPREPATWFDHIREHAFDLRNHVILAWSSPEELSRALTEHIEARGLRLRSN